MKNVWMLLKKLVSLILALRNHCAFRNLSVNKQEPPAADSNFFKTVHAIGMQDQ